LSYGYSPLPRGGDSACCSTKEESGATEAKEEEILTAYENTTKSNEKLVKELKDGSK